MTSTPARRRRRPWVLFWTGTAAVALALCGLKAGLVRSSRQALDAITAGDGPVWAQVADAHEAVYSLGPGAPPGWVRLRMRPFAPAVDDPAWTPPALRLVCRSSAYPIGAGWEATFEFSQNRLRSSTFEWSADPAVARVHAREAAAEWGRRSVAAAFGIGAFAVLFTAGIARSHRRSLGAIATAAALICGVGIALSDQPDRVFRASGWRLAVLPPAVLLVTGLGLSAWPARRRRGPGQCRRCGYDLTGNASGVCPECGTPLRPRADPSPVADALAAMVAPPTSDNADGQ